MERCPFPAARDGGSHAQARGAGGCGTCRASTRCVATRRSCRRSSGRGTTGARPGARSSTRTLRDWRRPATGDAAGADPLRRRRSWPGRDLATWERHICPLCGGEPDLAVITPAAERLLICGRCAGALALSSDLLPVLPERRPDADHVARQPRRQVPDQRLRRVPAIHQGLRRAPRPASGLAGRGFDRDPAAGRGGDPARISLINELRPNPGSALAAQAPRRRAALPPPLCTVVSRR